MDFQPKIKYILPTGTPLPYYLASRGEGGQVDLLMRDSLFPEGLIYPEYPCLKGMEKEDYDFAEDFEYLQRTCPALVARLQKRVEELIDTMDYEGSMIYDEFPDKLSLSDLGKAAARVLSRMEEAKESPGEKKTNPDAGGGLEEAYLQGLAQVLVCNEVFRRRQKKRKQGGYYGRITKNT